MTAPRRAAASTLHEDRMPGADDIFGARSRPADSAFSLWPPQPKREFEDASLSRTLGFSVCRRAFG